MNFTMPRSLRYFDWISFSIIIVLSCIGLAFVYSATYKPDLPLSLFFKKQLIGIISGIVIYVLFSFIDYRTLIRWGFFAYFGVIALLIFTLLKGKVGMGAQRWLDLYIIRLQPSELTKLFFPAFAIFIMQNQRPSEYLRTFFPIVGMLFVSFLLILKQPDLGTALVLLFTGLLLLWFLNIDTKFFIYGFAFLLITAPFSWYMLKPYQKNRIHVFLGYGSDKKERYHIEQSKIAIGSGGMLGNGFLQGIQNKLRFLPESRTDFIFSVICEEWGFCGAVFILLLFCLLFFRLFWLIFSLSNPLLAILSFGLVTHLLLCTIINICMVIGLMPIVGIPLPFLSYGLSNLWICFASLGWCNNIFMHRHAITEHYWMPQKSS